MHLPSATAANPIAAARNLGIERAQGDHIAHLDADDMWTADKLALQVEAFRATPDLDAVFGHITEFASPDVETEGIRVRTEPAPSYSPCTILIEREALRRVGPYRTKWQIGQDMDWHMRAQESGLNMTILPDVVLLRRIHDSNKGIVKRHLINQRVQIVKEALDRRRASRSRADAAPEPPK